MSHILRIWHSKLTSIYKLRFGKTSQRACEYVYSITTVEPHIENIFKKETWLILETARNSGIGKYGEGKIKEAKIQCGKI